MGHAAGLLDALPRGALPRRDPRRRLAGRAERVDLVRGARALGAGRRRARSSPRTCSPPGSTSRSPRATTRSRRTREIRKTAKLMGQFLPGHRLRHLGLLGDAARGQHVRRRQLRRRRPRRVADHPARLAGRRRDRAGRGGGRARRPCAGGAGDPGRVRGARLPAGHATRRSRRRRTATRAATCPTATAPPTSRRPTASSTRAISALDVVRELDAAGFADVAEAVLGMQRQRVVGRLPPDVGDHRARTAPCARRSAIRTATRARAPATASRASAGSCCSSCRTCSIRASRSRRTEGLSPVRETHVATIGDRSDEVVIAVGPAFGDALRETINGLPHADVLARSPTASGRAAPSRASSAFAAVSDVAFIGHDGAALSGSGIAVGLAVEGHRGHPPGRSPAARQPRAVRDVAALHARLLPRDGAERGRVRARAGGRARADRARQLRPRKADRAHDAPARARDRRGRPRRRRRSSSSSREDLLRRAAVHAGRASVHRRVRGSAPRRRLRRLRPARARARARRHGHGRADLREGLGGALARRTRCSRSSTARDRRRHRLRDRDLLRAHAERPVEEGDRRNRSTDLRAIARQRAARAR